MRCEDGLLLKEMAVRFQCISWQSCPILFDIYPKFLTEMSKWRGTLSPDGKGLPCLGDRFAVSAAPDFPPVAFEVSQPFGHRGRPVGIPRLGSQPFVAFAPSQPGVAKGDRQPIEGSVAIARCMVAPVLGRLGNLSLIGGLRGI